MFLQKNSDFRHFVTNGNYMVHSIQQRICIYIHPLKQLHYLCVAKQDTSCVNISCVAKTNWLMMGNPVSHSVDDIQCVKNVCVVILKFWGRGGLVWEYVQQTTARQSVLHIVEHVFPHPKLHLCQQFGMIVIMTSKEPFIRFFDDFLCTFNTRIRIESTTRQHKIAKPIIPVVHFHFFINLVSQRHFETTDYCIHFL